MHDAWAASSHCATVKLVLLCHNVAARQASSRASQHPRNLCISILPRALSLSAKRFAECGILALHFLNTNAAGPHPGETCTTLNQAGHNCKAADQSNCDRSQPWWKSVVEFRTTEPRRRPRPAGRRPAAPRTLNVLVCRIGPFPVLRITAVLEGATAPPTPRSPCCTRARYLTLWPSEIYDVAPRHHRRPGSALCRLENLRAPQAHELSEPLDFCTNGESEGGALTSSSGITSWHLFALAWRVEICFPAPPTLGARSAGLSNLVLQSAAGAHPRRAMIFRPTLPRKNPYCGFLRH